MTAIYIRFHGWRGIALTNDEPDLFSFVFVLGFLTVHICKRCVLTAYQKLRGTIEHVVEGR